MPLTDEQVAEIEKDIELAATAAAPIVAIFGPQATAGLIVGRVVARFLPRLVAIVERSIQGVPPTEDEKQMMRDELTVLNDPNLP